MLLPRLEGLPLLPVGAGRDGKAPVDPQTGKAMTEWQSAAWTPEQISSTAPAVVTAVGMRCGPDAGRLICFDLDGQSAIDAAVAAGCDWSSSWVITRPTAPDRMKVVFRLPEGVEAPSDGKAVHKTGRGEQVEVFYGTGQVVIGGLHRPSGAFLEWHRGPESIQDLPDAWLALWQQCSAAPAATTTKRRQRSDEWQPAVPCPICTRTKDNDCQVTRDGRTVLCHHGKTHHPPILGKGETITIGGVVWAACRETENAIGRCTVFKVHQPREAPERRRKAQKQPADSGEGSKVPERAPAATGNARRLDTAEVVECLPDRVGTIRLNVRTGDVHLGTGEVLNGNRVGRLYLDLSTPSETWPKDITIDALAAAADRNQFDPVQEWLTGLDATPVDMEAWGRLDLHLLGFDDPIAAKFLPRFLVSAVARVMEPGCECRQFPVLVGPQHRGKTALGRILFGDDHWVEGIGKLDRDAQQRCGMAWGVELAELDGVTRRADRESLKAFLSERVDTYRICYDRAPARHPRRFVFWGSSNAPPLNDPTGSTRFVVIKIPDRMLPLDWAREHRNALWARALEQYRAGFDWTRWSEDERDAIAERNADFTQTDPWGETVMGFLTQCLAGGSIPVTQDAIHNHLDVPRERQNNATALRIRQIAEGAGWALQRKRIPGVRGVRASGYWPPEAPTLSTPSTPCPPRGVDGQNDCGTIDLPTPSTPSTPIRQELENGVGGTGRGAAPQRGTAGSTGRVLGLLGVDGVDRGADRQRRKGFAVHGRDGRGVDGVDTGPIGSAGLDLEDDDDPAWGPRPAA